MTPNRILVMVNRLLAANIRPDRHREITLQKPHPGRVS